MSIRCWSNRLWSRLCLAVALTLTLLSTPLLAHSLASTPKSPGAAAAAGSVSRAEVFADEFGSVKGVGAHKVKLGRKGIPESEFQKLNLSDPSIIVLPLVKEPYVCRIPPPPTAPSPPTDSASQVTPEKLEKAVTLVSAIGQGKCLRHSQGWWTYEFCPHNEVRQYHLIAKTGQPDAILDYTLGKYSPVVPSDVFYGQRRGAGDAGAELVEHDDEGRHFLRQYWGKGTICDMTGRPRVVEIQYHCCGDEHISSVREVAVCVYIMTVHTPRVCGHPSFKSRPPSEPLPIICEPVVKAPTPQPTPKPAPADIKPPPISSPIPILDFTKSGCTSLSSCPNLNAPPTTEKPKQRARASGQPKLFGHQLSEEIKTPVSELFDAVEAALFGPLVEGDEEFTLIPHLPAKAIKFVGDDDEDEGGDAVGEDG
ncbi:Protein OS-9, partial [Borealophlyctis nickersoniae]